MVKISYNPKGTNQYIGDMNNSDDGEGAIVIDYIKDCELTKCNYRKTY